MELIIELILLFFVISIFILFARGAAFVPSSYAKVEKMIELARLKSGDVAVDLGSGDGRIVIALAKAGVIAHGYEINPFLVWWSRRKIRAAGLTDRAFIHWQNFWKVDFSKADVVIVYGISYIMRPLGKKLTRELKTGARIISYAFPFPSWNPNHKGAGIFLYVNPVTTGSRSRHYGNGVKP